jgi:hypothetical protein
MKKKLIVSGCSFVDKNFESMSSPSYDCSFPKWPELLAKKLDMDCINLGASGAGNNYIYSSLLEEIIRTPKEEIGLVLASWSQVNREDYQTKTKITTKDKINYKMNWRSNRIGREGDVFYWIKDLLRYYISLENLCKKNNLPYKQFQMLNSFEGYLNGLSKTDFEIVNNLDNPSFQKRHKYHPKTKDDRSECFKMLIEYEKFIDIKNFIGWPTIWSIGGYAIEEKTLMTDKRHNIRELHISKYDYHPNELGHQKIAEFLYERL